MKSNVHNQVVDNGHGVQNLRDLCETAPSNKRKVSRLVYGTKRGCLFHIVKLCEKVTVTTRRHNSTVTKVFRTYQKSEMSTEKQTRPSIGTTITVDNMFHNLPARLTSISYMDLENTKDVLLKIAIANPKVAISLKDIASGTKLFQTQSCSSFVDNFLIYSHNKVSWENMRDIKFENNGYRLEALLTPELYSKPWQVLLVNRRFVEDDRIKKFSNDILLSALTSSDKRNQENTFPVFLFSISCKPVYVDMCFESNNFLEFKDWDIIFNLIYSCISSFLEAEEIVFPVSDEDSSYSSSPLHSMKSLLKAASPNVNITSKKAQRPNGCSEHTEKVLPIESDDLVSNTKMGYSENNSNIMGTPRKSNHCKLTSNKRELENLNFTPSKNNKQVCTSGNTISKQNSKVISHVDDFKFKTPPPKTKNFSSFKSTLGNAPILSHLLDAKDKLDMIDEDNHVKSNLDLENAGLYSSDSRSEDILKRRSSTPLCVSRNKELTLNISPIEFRKSQINRQPSVSNQDKRKRTQRPSKRGQVPSNQISKARDTSQENKFSVKTPHYILDSSKYLCYVADTFSSSKSYRNNRLTSDSGYDTTSKQVDIEHEKVTDSSDEFCNMFLETDSPVFHLKKKPKSSTNYLLEDKNDMSNNVPERHYPSLQNFDIYHDNPDSCQSNLDHKDLKSDNSSSTNSVPIFEYQESSSKSKVISGSNDLALSNANCMINCPSTIIVKHKDCASSPISIPVERGCSPIKFSQLQSQMAIVKPSLELEVNNERITKGSDHVVSESPGNALSDISDSILNCVDEKVNALNRSSSYDCNDSKKDDISGLESEKLQSPCFECHTQSVMKRLDFSSQCKASNAVNVAQKENIPPTYREIIPISAASHLVSSFTPWSKQNPKLTLPNKPSSFDIRKWKSGVFETHGQGFMDVKKNSASHMNFIFDACRFNKSVFNGLDVIGQIDEKFIGCVTADDLLILVDQHAAHERVRLECMLNNLHQNGDQTNPISSQMLKAPIPAPFSKPERQFIFNITNKLQFIGFIIDVSKHNVNLIAIPSVCFFDSGDLNISVDDVIVSFNQAVTQIRDSEGSNLALPRKLVEYLHSKACHGAIRFGDELKLNQCRILLKQLSVCDLPFQCAHGRPSFAPIIKLNEPENSSLDSDCKSELGLLKLRSRFQ